MSSPTHQSLNFFRHCYPRRPHMGVSEPWRSTNGIWIPSTLSEPHSKWGTKPDCQGTINMVSLWWGLSSLWEMNFQSKGWSFVFGYKEMKRLSVKVINARISFAGAEGVCMERGFQRGNDLLSYNMICAYRHVFFMWTDVCVSICVYVEELECKKKNPTAQMKKICSFMKKMGLFSFGCIAYIVVSLIFKIKILVLFKNVWQTK